MNPIRTVAPADPIITLAVLKQHLRVDFDDDDEVIQIYLNAAMGWLDGYRGVLGRCIMPQTWQVAYDTPGTHRLPFPDVQTVTASVGTATLTADRCGSFVTLTDAATVTLTARAPDDILPQIKQIVLLIVATWYEQRKSTGEANLAELPMTVAALLAPIRWVQA